VLEYRMAMRVAFSHDFREGVRATIIEKGQTPAWEPADLDGVDAAAIEGMFAPLEDGDELSF
jgi:enoyl-CoA hydratase